jgi:hypothetical protein
MTAQGSVRIHCASCRASAFVTAFGGIGTVPQTPTQPLIPRAAGPDGRRLERSTLAVLLAVLTALLAVRLLLAAALAVLLVLLAAALAVAFLLAAALPVALLLVALLLAAAAVLLVLLTALAVLLVLHGAAPDSDLRKAGRRPTPRFGNGHARACDHEGTTTGKPATRRRPQPCMLAPARERRPRGKFP